MLKFYQVYQTICTSIVSIGLILLIIVSIINFSIKDIDKSSGYRILQFPDENKIVTFIYATQWGDESIVYSSYANFTIGNIDSVACAKKSQAEKAVKSFKKLN